jgi:hypothetical protein
VICLSLMVRNSNLIDDLSLFPLFLPTVYAMTDLGAGAIFGAINSAFKFSEFVIALNEVGRENNVFVRTIQRVKFDLEETERLLHLPEVKAALAKQPAKIPWINEAIVSTKTALNEIGKYVERARSDEARDGSIGFAVRVRWVLNDHDKLENRRMELNACHLTLSNVLTMLQRLESIEPFSTVPLQPQSSVPDEAPPTYEAVVGDETFISPHMRRKARKEATQPTVVTEEAVVGNEVFISPYMRRKSRKKAIQPTVSTEEIQIDTKTDIGRMIA